MLRSAEARVRGGKDLLVIFALDAGTVGVSALAHLIKRTGSQYLIAIYGRNRAYLAGVLGHAVLGDETAGIGHLEAGVVLDGVGTLIDAVLRSNEQISLASRKDEQKRNLRRSYQWLFIVDGKKLRTRKREWGTHPSDGEHIRRRPAGRLRREQPRERRRQRT